MAQEDPAILAIQEFAKITDVDEGFAHFILQDYDFDLQVFKHFIYKFHHL